MYLTYMDQMYYMLLQNSKSPLKKIPINKKDVWFIPLISTDFMCLFVFGFFFFIQLMSMKSGTECIVCNKMKYFNLFVPILSEVSHT